MRKTIQFGNGNLQGSKRRTVEHILSDFSFILIEILNQDSPPNLYLLIPLIPLFKILSDDVGTYSLFFVKEGSGQFL